MKCDLPKHDLFDASLLVNMYKTGHKEAKAVKCIICGEYHVIREDDDEAAKAEKV